MKKRVRGRRFARKEGPRKALVHSLMRSLVLHEKMKTTQAKAREVSPLVEKLVTRAKKGDIASRRHAAALLGNEAAKKLLDEIAPRYQERKGGYTRISKLTRRASDSAKMAVIEFVKS